MDAMIRNGTDTFVLMPIFPLRLAAAGFHTDSEILT